MPAADSTPRAFRHVVLDRDGVLNCERENQWITEREAWAWESGALEGLRLLHLGGIEVSVATNQSCIARKVVSAADVERLHHWMRAEAQTHGAAITRVLVCPHVDEDGCSCRKPKPGMLIDAVRLSGWAPEHTIAIGDSMRDLEAARAAGVRAVLVRTGKGRSEERRCRALADWVFDDLHAAASYITGLEK